MNGARAHMVDAQLRRRGITDARVLGALGSIPRERFVPEALAAHAYEDHPIAIGYGQTISQPYIVAYMTECLDLRGTERVLEVGTGSGYQTAVLAELAAEVWSIEIVPELALGARRVLAELGYRNVHQRIGDGHLGWPEAAPFDRILVAAAPLAVPRALVEQCADGGRLVIPVGGDKQELFMITREGPNTFQRSTIPVRFVPMTHDFRPRSPEP